MRSGILGEMRHATLALALAGCFKPSELADCSVRCMQGADTCPDGMSCGASGLCSAGGNGCAGDPLFDGPPATGDGPDAPPGNDCHGTDIARICHPIPAGTLDLDTRIDTDSDPLCAVPSEPSSPDLCVISAADINVGSVPVVGTRPLVLVANTITVAGHLDASSHRGSLTPGAGADPGCASMSGSPMTPGTGGAGGSFARSGGSGGATAVLGPTPAAQTVPFLTTIRGGCSGGAGGADAVGGRASSGIGGGAVIVVATDKISVVGVISASGAGAMTPGAFGANLQGGGGGGGSGGLIVLEAQTISFSSGSRLIAIGGGGSAGGNMQFAGGAGEDPNPVAPQVGGIAAPGGISPASAGAGGMGSSNGAGTDGGPAMSATGGGGGGGGGDGHIQLRCPSCTTGNAIILPSPLIVPPAS